MTRSFRNVVVGVVSAAAVLALVTVAGSAAAQTQITGCCIGPTCSNQNARTCNASGGTPLDSTCKNANDPRCGSCADIPETAPRGLCNAYCDRLNCPAGHGGMACDQLRKNWMRATNLTAFPCDGRDRAVCCQCPGALPTCSSAKRCLKAQCQIIDRCINGECPEPQCCECEDQSKDPPTYACGNRRPRACEQLGCTPEAGAVCSPLSHRCEEPCPCGADCEDDAGNTGRCVTVSGAAECLCKVPPPCGLNTAGQCGGECDDATDKCTLVTDASGAVKCECQPPPPPDPCTNMTPCAATCVDPQGNPGICQETAAAGCRCLPAPPDPCDPPTGTSCAGPCVTATNELGTCTIENTNGGDCVCQPPRQPCNESDPDTCDGLCTAAGTLCLPDPTAPNGGCRCQPPLKCEDGVAPQCGGVCPAPLTCQPGTANDACVCREDITCNATCSPIDCTAKGIPGRCTLNAATESCDCLTVTTGP